MASVERVLVTGAGGFIGSHLVEALAADGQRVRAFLRYTSQQGRGWLNELPEPMASRVEPFFGDIRDPRAVEEALDGCGLVYHLAALIGIPYSYRAPASYLEVIAGGTLNLLEAARRGPTPRLVVTSTSEVYGTARYTPIDEEHPLQAQSPYAAAKIAADQMALAYHRSFGLPVALVRPFNTYGPRQGTRAVLPTILSQALTAERLALGSLAPVRDLVYVDDVVAGFRAVAASDACLGQVTNLATGRGVAIGELAAMALAAVGRDLPIVEDRQRIRPEASEVLALIGSAERARQRCGWRPTVGLEQGIGRTLAWLKPNLGQVRGAEYGQ